MMLYPERIVIELTAECNLSCPMCPRHFISEKKGQMSALLWKKLISEIAGNSPESIILPFWRGESLLHLRFKEFISLAQEKGLHIHMATNGVLVAKDCAQVLAKCDFINFSIHNKVGFEKAKEFLKLNKKNRPVIQVSFVRNEAGVQDLLAELLGREDLCGFDSVRIFEEHTKQGVFGKTDKVSIRQRSFCPKLENTLVIAYDGTISRCNHIWETEEDMNLSVDGMNIKKLWGSGWFVDIRRKYPDSLCSVCDQWIGHTCGEVFRMFQGKIERKVFST